MHSNQFDELKSKLPPRHWGTVPEHINVMLYITTGRQKGKIGRLIFIDRSDLTVQVEDNKPLIYPYTKVELVDENNQPIFAASLDITGRPVTGNNVVCYSISSGNSSHALEIGRVVKTNPSGSLTVKPIIRNGTRIEPGYWNRERSSIRANRVIILPVDATMVTTWVLSDFDLYKTDLVED